MPETKNIRTAMHEVWEKISTLTKNEFNSFGKYQYVPSEEAQEAVRNIIGKAGLLVQQTRSNITIGNGLNTVMFTHTVTHVPSGESIEYVMDVPIPQTKQPLDKVVFGLSTSALMYFLLRMFMIPREDPNQTDKRPPDEPQDLADQIKAELHRVEPNPAEHSKLIRSATKDRYRSIIGTPKQHWPLLLQRLKEMQPHVDEGSDG